MKTTPYWTVLVKQNSRLIKNRPELPQLAAFGANVRREHVARKLTQEKLAELMEVNPRTAQKIEARRLNILLTTILRLQKALKGQASSIRVSVWFKRLARTLAPPI